MQQVKKENRTSKFPIILIAILLVAVLLRFHDLDRTSLWYDEAVSWAQSNGSLVDLFSAVAKDNYPPLHNIVLWLTMPVIGDSETALRIPSAALGVLAVWLTYLIGWMIGGKPTGLLAAALLAVSPFHIWYSTEARMYALLAATGLAFLLSLLKVLERPSASWLTTLALSGTLFLYSHIYAVLAFLAVGFACAFFVLIDAVRERNFSRSNALRACIAMAVGATAFFPWLVILTNRARSVAETGFWIAYPDATFLKSLAFSVSGSLALFLVLVGLAVFSLFRPLLQVDESETEIRKYQRSLIVIFAFSAGPLILAYLYSVLVQPILFDRYLIAAWPGLLLLASEGANRILPR
ncbi:MAG: glycosyltransferase family 39 protein, partial [Pseudomonadota bacterium]